MNCERYKDMLPLYVSGDLTPKESEQIKKHLDTCADCQTEFKGLSEIAAMLAPTNSDSLSDIEKLRLENQIYHRLAESTSKNLWARTGFRPAGVLLRIAAVFAIFFLGYGARPLISGSGEGYQPTARVTEMSLDLTKYRQAPASMLRFSAEGLRVIARGRSALTIEPE